jgi:hypothetical protein
VRTNLAELRDELDMYSDSEFPIVGTLPTLLALIAVVEAALRGGDNGTDRYEFGYHEWNALQEALAPFRDAS